MSDMTRRGWLAAASGAALSACGGETNSAAPAAAEPPPFELADLTIEELGRRLAEGADTAASLVDKYLARVEEIDRGGPALNALIEVNPEAASVAAALDEERRAGRIRGPLHGVPIVIKDNIDTGDRMTTTAGSLALDGSIAAADAGVAAALRRAGAVILGKTNLSEWANFRSSRSTSGWSGRGGLTRNPYALDRNPCGSSSGSGVAAAASLCAAAVGTETNGSVVCPSSINGLVGVKPTVGLISQAGIIPISRSQDTAGPMARTVADAVALFEGMISPDERAAGRELADYRRFLDPDGLRGARIGVARQLFGTRPDVERLMEEALDALRGAGAELIEVEDLPAREEFGRDPFEVMLFEFKDGLNRYLGALGPNVEVRSLADLIAFNERNRDREMPYFEQEILIQAEERGGLDTADYRRVLEKTRRLAGPDGIDKVVAAHRLDALTAPTTTPAWTTDLLHGDHSSGGGGASSPAARSGYPHITVPGGFSHELPVGVSFFGPAFSEPILIKLASGFEATTKRRRPPRFLPTAPLS